MHFEKKQFLIMSKSVTDAALGPFSTQHQNGQNFALNWREKVTEGVTQLLTNMLDMRAQTRAHSKDKGLISHVCAKCVIEAMRLPEGLSRITKQVRCLLLHVFSF
jgi:hypothetical protein